MKSRVATNTALESALIRMLGATILTVLSIAGSAHTTLAEVKPGDFITPANATKARDLVSPGVYYKVVNGMSMKIVPSQRVEWPPPYKEATEKYSNQVRLSKDGRTAIGYVAGAPFPLIDVNDPQAAVKVAWNNAFRPIWTDDYDDRFYDCDSQYEANHAQTSQVFYTQVGHYAGYNLVGRTEVEPIPIDPDFKITGRYWLHGTYPVLSPPQLRGDGFIRYRYADPQRGDDMWNWTAGTRRVRRLNESTMSITNGPYGGWDPDHYSGFNAKIEEYDWKMLGEKGMLGVVHAEHSPEVRCPTDNGTSACPEAWEMRHMYILEATPRRELGEATGALHSKTLIYTDSEVMWPSYIDTYDRAGHLFGNNIYYLVNRDRSVPDARVAIYPFNREFIVGTVSTNIQSGQAMMCYFPGMETPERECWYINMGSVDKSFFTIQAITKAAP